MGLEPTTLGRTPMFYQFNYPRPYKLQRKPELTPISEVIGVLILVSLGAHYHTVPNICFYLENEDNL